jgi:hypothetical protein
VIDLMKFKNAGGAPSGATEQGSGALKKKAGEE